MSDQPPGKPSKKSHLLRPLKGLFSRLRSSSPSGTQSVTPHNATASISATNDATSLPQASYQGAQSVTPNNATASIFASPTNDGTSAPQSSYRAQSVTPHNEKGSISASPTIGATSAPQDIPQGTEYTAILDLPTTPTTPLTWEHRMKECGST